MKRFRIEVTKNGVAVYDRKNKRYLIDASTIETDNSFTIAKEETIRKRGFNWESRIIYSVKTPKAKR